MSYSNESLAFSTIPASEQIRLEDRVSFLYLEYCLIRQDRTGVISVSRGDEKAPAELKDLPIKARIQLPVGGIAVLMLGPGTSISQPAATSCARAGVSVLFTGGGGVQAYSLSTPLTSSARWAIAQARLASNEAKQRTAARILYKRQLGIEEIEADSIAVMRGIEGRTIRNLYKRLSAKYKIKNFKRDTNATDPVNTNLNLGNSILYGCAASACAALGINPALGIIHRGDIRSLLFDLADLYKPTLTIPAAFKCANNDDDGSEFRRLVRSEIVKQDLLKNMIHIMMEILAPYLPERTDDRLIGGRNREVPGHTQYGGK
ncbi:subtype I-E CRISPR-associated endonuclease Cas1 [Corynebacterium pseudotuberculosis]|uniref:type I-E CRISPR-associated endonuclease Cas1e n=1 Tax=Corynebacterium pseudotuberculosis TaxID=1719 RepID=UPI0006560ABF|nr:type I-E CRISPR-associated endonuclease Cas1e [Corynebacterium pseudotuberculosis]AKN59548.1 type I-E CRISPR-associated endonuclease Cas1 [Corynebacterium pseudotuberculosis 31]APB09990.1 subtype I-E CRISPR-associated endonuclease Cas1 [Corynebacterium pseudotuberculosis]APB12038.1 subtype I-E CRISPR-associated endonuclease Cas1 [Corynebacterium pseudotuberculosis]APB14084.1 subtype I-E CRISPR-associated endonuclease Cas1 [Corynebacterium pseudotuberculosis]APB16133.1 subtype I-E CRISPR-ass